jgi:hypothetical protein
MVKPPTLRPTDPEARARHVIVQNIDRDDRASGRRRGESGLIAQPQILAKPDDVRGHASSWSRRIVEAGADQIACGSALGVRQSAGGG